MPAPKPDARRLIRAKMQMLESFQALRMTRLSQKQLRVLNNIEDSIRIILEEHEREMLQDPIQVVNTTVSSENGLKAIETAKAETRYAKEQTDRILTKLRRLIEQFEESHLPESPLLVQTEAATDEDPHGS